MGCRASFQFFIAQDASFLAAFARAYLLAAQKAEQQHSPAVVAAIRSLMQGVQEELALHASYAAVRLCHLGVQYYLKVLLLLSLSCSLMILILENKVRLKVLRRVALYSGGSS